MKLIVNKKEAKMLEDIFIDSNNKKACINCKKDNINKIEISVYNKDAIDMNFKIQNIFIFVDDDENYFIGIRNRYGNGVRFIPFNALLNLLWEDETGLNNIKELKACKSSYKVI